MKKLLAIIASLLPLLCSAVLGTGAYAQDGPAVLDPAKALTQYVHHVWHADDGLPQNSVGGIVQTRDGYLWLGTEEGLVRFDGLRFTVFDPSNTPAFEGSQIIHALAEDAAGALWIGTQGGGLIRYVRGTFQRFGEADGFTGAWVGALWPDASGRLWIGTRDAGLFMYHAGTFHQFTTDDGLTSNRISALAQDSDGSLWIGTEGGLNRLDDGYISTYKHGDGDDFILALHRAADGTLWAGTHQGLSRLRAERLERYTPETGAKALGGVWTFWEDAAGSLWLGMVNGLGRLRAGRLESFTMKDGLSHDRVLALYGDREGSLWIGTEGGGLNQLWDGKFSVFTTREGLSLDVVLSLYEDADGVLWAGTQGGGLNRLDGTRLTAYTTADGLPSDVVTSVYGTPDGALWVGTLEGGLARLKEERLTSFSTRDGLPSDDIYALYGTPDGTLWIGTDAGVARFEDDRFTSLSTTDGLGSDLITTLLETDDGALWIGTYDGGVSRYQDGRFTVFTTDDGLGSNTVTALHEDSDGVLWVGTYGGGLSRYAPGAAAARPFTTLTSKEGLFNDNIYAILEDATGTFWMSCNKGLFTVRKAALDAFMAGRAARVPTTTYGKDDGLKSSEMNGGTSPSAWKRHDGSLWFPTLQGLVGIDPQQIRHNRMAPLVAVEEMRVDNQPVDLDAAVALAPGKKKIDFRFTALSFVAPETIRFRYILEGYDTAWQEKTEGRTATYTNLPPGAYTFRVLARNSDGVWNEAGVAIHFTLTPFFYQTFWFYALCIAGLLLLVGGGYNLRVRQLKHRERELQTLVEIRTEDLRTAKDKIEAQAHKLQELDRFKTRFFANVSHEFRTPLTMIVGPLENALHGNYGAIDSPMRRQLEIMLRNAMRLMRLINQLLDLSKLEAGKMELKARPRNLVPFLEGVVFSFTAFAEQKGVVLNLAAETRDVQVYFEPDKLEKVFFNLLSNAVKFTPPQGRIDVTLAALPPSEAAPEGAVAVRVRDTGPGIPPEALPYIFDRFRQVDGSNTREHEGTGIGLALVKELVLLHCGTIEVESEVGNGTEFVVHLPLGDAHLQPGQAVATGDPDDGDFTPEDSAMAELAFAAQQFMAEATPNGQPATLPAEAPLVLLVEDNPDVREYVASILGQKYRIATATDGAEGLEQARALEPDLIISDVMMPKMDGNAMCRAIKADPALRHLPVVLLTARATQQMRIEGLEVGADDYLAKPFNARELLARARNLIQLRQQERALKKLNSSLEEQVEAQVETILEERRRYEEQLIQAKDQAEASLRLKTAILDNMNHEFRTPLTAIQGYAQILEKEVHAELREFAGHIDQSGERLMRTLDAVHQLSLLEADNYEVALESTDVVEQARQATQRFANQAKTKDLKLHLEVPAAPLHVSLDRAALTRILDYLLDNAIKFTDSGEVALVVTPQPGGARLSVRDTGQGIDTKFLPILFDAFTQESSGLTRDHHGMGVSLTVAQRLTRLMGGSISVSSEKGRGSIFTLHFPATTAPTRIHRFEHHRTA